MPAVTAYVAMLRGINVGSTNRIAMSALRDAVAGLGYGDVRTYVQSGNLVFTATAKARSGDAKARSGDGTGEVADRVAGAITDAFGLDVPVVVRTGSQLAAVLVHGPFVKEGLHPEEAPTSFHVTFLGEPPAEAKWAAAVDEAERFAPDVCRLVGADVHLHVPGGRYSDSKLTNAWFEKRLGVVATTRNWKTAGVLAEMAADIG